jgi:thiamine biosynthesis lipoprotein
MTGGARRGVHRVEQIMGTAISLEITDLLDRQDLRTLADEVFAWFREVDERFSTYKPDSELNRLHRGELTRDECSTDMHRVLDECAWLWTATSGYFDVCATGRLDPSGYVKGWSVQVASNRLAERGAVNHCINAGGDICLRGEESPGQPWRIGVLHPWERTKLAWVLSVTDMAIATSGTYERGLHVINPYTGLGMDELRSVTVVGPDLALADAYATTAMAMGLSGLDWLSGLVGYESAVITEDGRGFQSGGLPEAA